MSACSTYLARRSEQAHKLNLHPGQRWKSSSAVYTIVDVRGWRVLVEQDCYGDQVFELDREFFLSCTLV